MVECGGLENRYGASHRGFESLPLRHGGCLERWNGFNETRTRLMALQDNNTEAEAVPQGEPEAQATPPPAEAKPAPTTVNAPAAKAGTVQPEGDAAEEQGSGTSADGGGTGMYIFLGVLLALFAFLWYRGHLQAFRRYVAETREQLRKCTWPTRDELYQHTVVVLLSSMLMGVFTVTSDQVAAGLIWDLLLDVPTSVFSKLFG